MGLLQELKANAYSARHKLGVGRDGVYRAETMLMEGRMVPAFVQLGITKKSLEDALSELEGVLDLIDGLRETDVEEAPELPRTFGVPDNLENNQPVIYIGEQAHKFGIELPVPPGTKGVVRKGWYSFPYVGFIDPYDNMHKVYPADLQPYVEGGDDDTGDSPDGGASLPG